MTGAAGRPGAVEALRMLAGPGGSGSERSGYFLLVPLMGLGLGTVAVMDRSARHDPTCLGPGAPGLPRGPGHGKLRTEEDGTDDSDVVDSDSGAVGPTRVTLCRKDRRVPAALLPLMIPT